MSISIVVARSLNHVIGKGSEIPWQVKGEQKLFKEITFGGVLIMGRKTFESIGRPLPGRTTIIVSRNPQFTHDGCMVASSLNEAIDSAKALDKPIHVVGGGEIYSQALPLADEVHLSEIQTEVEGDIFFSDFPTPEFTLANETRFESNIDYIYKHYIRN